MKRTTLLPVMLHCVTLAAQTKDDFSQLVTYATRINYFNQKESGGDSC